MTGTSRSQQVRRPDFLSRCSVSQKTTHSLATQCYRKPMAGLTSSPQTQASMRRRRTTMSRGTEQPDATLLELQDVPIAPLLNTSLRKQNCLAPTWIALSADAHPTATCNSNRGPQNVPSFCGEVYTQYWEDFTARASPTIS